MSNINYVLKSGNPKESAGKGKTTFSLRKKALKEKKKIDLLVTNGLRFFSNFSLSTSGFKIFQHLFQEKVFLLTTDLRLFKNFLVFNHCI